MHPKERKPNQVGTRPEERERFARLLDAGLVDVGRALDPANDELFTWWAPWRNLRQRNIGWRIDYVLASTGRPDGRLVRFKTGLRDERSCPARRRLCVEVKRGGEGRGGGGPGKGGGGPERGNPNVQTAMSLRTRLIVAFFVLAVLPLAAVTFYTYQSNEQALREAAEREADLLAGELGQRMQLVTAQLSQRVEHLMDIQELETALRAAESEAARKRRSRARPSSQAPTPCWAIKSLDRSVKRRCC